MDPEKSGLPGRQGKNEQYSRLHKPSEMASLSAHQHLRNDSSPIVHPQAGFKKEA
jgi:hypothetical protein